MMGTKKCSELKLVDLNLERNINMRGNEHNFPRSTQNASFKILFGSQLK